MLDWQKFVSWWVAETTPLSAEILVCWKIFFGLENFLTEMQSLGLKVFLFGKM